MADIVIINPRFDISFWGMEHCIGLLGKRANLPVACLALLAALVPDQHNVTLDRRKRRGHRFCQARPRRPRVPHRHEHPGQEDARDPGESPLVRGHDRRWRVVGNGRGRGARRSCRCRVRRRGRRDLAAIPGDGPPQTATQATNDVTRCRCRASICSRPTATCSAACRFPRLPFHLRVLRHHRHFGGARAQDQPQVLAELEAFAAAQRRLRGRRQSHRQQEGDQADPARHRAGSSSAPIR